MKFRLFQFAIALLMTLGSRANGDEPTLSIGVLADFTKGEMAVTEVKPNSPAMQMRGPDNRLSQLEVHDVIVSVEGQPIRTPAEFFGQINRSTDGHINVVVRDWRTSNENRFTIEAKPIGTTALAIARDTYLREARSTQGKNSRPIDLIAVDGNIAVYMVPLIELIPLEDADISRQDMLASLLRCLAALKEYVLAHPNPKCFDRVFLLDLDNQIAPLYESIVSSQMAESHRIALTKQLCEQADEAIRRKFQNWADENGYLVERRYGTGAKVRFRPVLGRSSAILELMAGADMVLTLLHNNESAKQVTPRGAQLLDSSILWKRPTVANGEISVYAGAYYYRLVHPRQDGTLQTDKFDLNRRQSISEPNSGEEISFP